MTEENYNYRTSQTLLRNQFPGKGKLKIPIILHTPLQKCSLTADDGASSPLEWCTHSAEMVHGGRRRGAPGRHARCYSGMPLRLRMDSPSIWMV